MKLKIGNKVRNIHNNLEGKIVKSIFGVSVSGWYYDEEGNKCYFKTLGMSLDEVAKDWKRVYKFKYNMENFGWQAYFYKSV